MPKLLAVLVTCAVAATSGAAFADPSQPYGMDRNSGHQSAGDLPHCDRPIGVAAVRGQPDRDWWSPLGSTPRRCSRCAWGSVVGLPADGRPHKASATCSQEEGLNSGGQLQRGSNIGRGQVLAADYFIIPDIARQNSILVAATSLACSAASCRARPV